MDRAVLDTSVLLAPSPRPLPGELAISVVSLAELHFGVLVTTDPDRRAQRLRRLTALTRRFDPLPIDEAVAEQYGALAARTVAAGRSPRARVMDLLIAATARAHDAVLYTRNPDDLRGLEDLITVVPV
jgi:predicted nucleic acid-binding protein